MIGGALLIENDLYTDMRTLSSLFSKKNNYNKILLYSQHHL